MLLAEDEKRTSTVRWPCMCVMQAAAVLRMVRLANFPDALQHHAMQPSSPILQLLQPHADVVFMCFCIRPLSVHRLYNDIT